MRMIGLNRRTAIGSVAVLVASGCIWLGSSVDSSTTHVQSADIASQNPPLAAFALRVARADLPLDAKEDALAAKLERDCESWMQNIDRARVQLIDTLVDDVAQRRFSPATAKARADRVVSATDDAAPHLDGALAQLHDALDVWQRRALEQAVRSRFLGWSTSWNAQASNDHGWLTTLSAPALASGQTIDNDAHTTARHWADSLVDDVESKATSDAFSDADRRDLVTSLQMLVMR